MPPEPGARRRGRFPLLASWALLLATGCSVPVVPGGDPPLPRVHLPEPGVLSVTTEAGHTIGYFEEGTGPLVVMVHGFPDTPHTWDRIRPVVAAAGFHVVTPWLLGYTPSSTPWDVPSYQAKELGQELLALIDALGEEQAILIGHDWGASSSYSATIQDPRKVRKLVSMAIPHHGVKSDLFFLWRARHFVYLTWENAEEGFARDDFHHVDELYARWSPQWTPPPGEFEPVKNCYADPDAETGALNYYRALWLDGPPAPFLEQPVTVPTLAFAGLSDGIVTEAMWDQTPAHFTSTYKLVKLSGGHWVHRENEAEVLAQLLPFLAE